MSEASEPKKRGRPKGAKNKRKYRQPYRPEVKADALALYEANGRNCEGTAQLMGIPKQTMQEWLTNGTAERLAPMIEAKKQDLAFEIETVVFKMLAQIPGAAEKASVKDLALGSAILIDKMRILRGQSSQITQQSITVSDDARKRQAELAVAQFITMAEKRGAKLTREQAVAKLSELEPEIADYLN